MTDSRTQTENKIQRVRSWRARLWEIIKNLLLALVIALVARTFVFEPFRIPSGSMKPTLLVGDFLFVSKASYGFSRYSFPIIGSFLNFGGRILGEEPKRGDVVVFRLPSDPSVIYIKRLIGMPGDRVQVIEGALYINGNLVERQSLGFELVENHLGFPVKMTVYQETLPNGVRHKIWEVSDHEALDNTPVFSVPEGHYFFMGDNRDNSQDSRVLRAVGPVPYENLVGRADLLFFSIGDGLLDIRFGRIGQTIN